MRVSLCGHDNSNYGQQSSKKSSSESSAKDRKWQSTSQQTMPVYSLWLHLNNNVGPFVTELIIITIYQNFLYIYNTSISSLSRTLIFHDHETRLPCRRVEKHFWRVGQTKYCRPRINLSQNKEVTLDRPNLHKQAHSPGTTVGHWIGVRMQVVLHRRLIIFIY